MLSLPRPTVPGSSRLSFAFRLAVKQGGSSSTAEGF
jgi:hypothetical protein